MKGDEFLEIVKITKKDTIKAIIKDLQDQRLCSNCGHPLLVNDHYCEECKARISVPTDTDGLIKYLKKFGVK